MIANDKTQHLLITTRPHLEVLLPYYFIFIHSRISMWKNVVL